MAVKKYLKRILKCIIPNYFLKTYRRKHKRSTSLHEESRKYYTALKTSVKIICDNQNKITPILGSFKDELVNPNIFEQNWWLSLLKVSSIDDKNGKKLQESLINRIDDLELANIVVRDFIHFYSLALRVGLFNVGYALRNKAREAAFYKLINNQTKYTSEIEYGIGALIEKEGFSRINEFKKIICKNNFVYKNSLNDLKMINEGSYGSLKNEDLNRYDLQYKNFMEGKDVAIVGPAKNNSKDAEEIDSYDIVVRCNHYNKVEESEKRSKGIKTDVAYLNGAISNYLIKDNFLNWPNELQWVVCKNKKHLKDIKYLTSNIKNRYMDKYDSVLFHGHLNLIPMIVLDVLKNNPRSVKIYHADLMVTIEKNKGYKSVEWDDNVPMKQRFLISSSDSHDPVTQYSILNRLWICGLIDGDDRFNEVMSFGEKKYMVKLQELYGEAGRFTVGQVNLN
ncbi:MAG: hypothetical protein WDZ80_03125 [Candidatus Paceibacterota bacterium]